MDLRKQYGNQDDWSRIITHLIGSSIKISDIESNENAAANKIDNSIPLYGVYPSSSTPFNLKAKTTIDLGLKRAEFITVTLNPIENKVIFSSNAFQYEGNLQPNQEYRLAVGMGWDT